MFWLPPTLEIQLAPYPRLYPSPPRKKPLHSTYNLQFNETCITSYFNCTANALRLEKSTYTVHITSDLTRHVKLFNLAVHVSFTQTCYALNPPLRRLDSRAPITETIHDHEGYDHEP